MDALQAVNRIKTLLQARKLNADNTAKPAFGSVVITQAPLEQAMSQLKTPYCLIRLGSSTADDEEPALLTQQINILLVVSVYGDYMGERPMIGSNVETKSPQGRGILEMQRELLAVCRLLNDTTGVRILERAKSAVMVNKDEEFGYIAAREYAFDLKCTDYPELFSISGSVGISGVTVTAGGIYTTSRVGGAYTITGLDSGTYTVTPTFSGYTFTPATQSVTIGASNITGVNFTTSPIIPLIPYQTDLISWWEGQDNATDSQDSNNGIASTGVSYVNGKVGKAFNIDGSTNPSSNILIASNDNLQPLDITIGAFVNLSILDLDFNNPIFGKFSVNPALGQYAITISTAGKPRFWNNGSEVESNISVSINTWYYLSATFEDSTGVATIYICDTTGTVLDSVSSVIGGHIGSTNNPCRIGGSYDADLEDTFRFTGKIDEVVIYHRALSQAEIQQLATASNY